MSNSEIFDNYAKLAVEKGLISSAADDNVQEDKKSTDNKSTDSPKLKKFKKSPSARAGSDDISTIELMYGVKPNSSIEYKNNIMEAAHPHSVIIAPSYDKLNGLVENNIERNNIMCNIALKPTNGNSTYHKYAEQDLIQSLVKIANYMDCKDDDQLRILADACIQEFEKKKV